MPIRFTCRLSAVRTESGKIRLCYQPLGEKHLRFLTIHGPEMVLPPEEEMTDEEFDRWEWDLCCRTGFSTSMESTPLDAPLVEARRTFEDQIPPGSVRAELFWAHNDAGARTLGVRVTNEWNQPIPRFSLSTDCHYDAPQPEQMVSVPALALGERESMFHPLGATTGGDLWPRLPVSFYLDPSVLGSLRSRAASLSTESQWIAMRTDGYEFDRIPGEMVAAFLDSEEQP
jgi:hypothetical protein